MPSDCRTAATKEEEIMNLKQFISAGNNRYLDHIDDHESMEEFYASKDWKDLAAIKYRFFCQVAEEANLDARKEFGMPDGENCPRAFRNWTEKMFKKQWKLREDYLKES